MNRKQKTAILIASFLIPVITVLTGFISGGFAPFGKMDVFSAGDMYDYIPYFSELYDRVHGGEALSYSLREGPGYDFTTIWTYYLSDPANLLVLLFPKSAMYTVFNILYMMKIGLAGLFFAVFLMYRQQRVISSRDAMACARHDEIEAYREKLAVRKAKKDTGKKDFKIGRENPGSHIGQLLACLDFKIPAFSVAYALSSYMLGMGFNICLLGSVCIFPLIMMGIDRLIYEGRWRLFAITMTVSFYLSFYMTTVILVFLFFYILIHEYRSLRHFFKSLLLTILSLIISAGCAMLIILPCVKGRVFSDLISLQFDTMEVTGGISETITGLLIHSVPSNLSVYSIGINIFCSVSVLILLFCYMLNRTIRLSDKFRNAGLLIVLILGTFLNTPNYLLNAFFYSVDNMCAFGFILVFMLLCISFEALENISYNRTLHVNISAVIAFGLVFFALIFVLGYDSMSAYMISMEVLAVYYVIILLYKSDSMAKYIFTMLISLVMIAEIMFNYVSVMDMFKDNVASYEDTYVCKSELALDYLHEKYPDARVLYYDPKASESTPLTNMLLGYRYIITPETSENVDSLLEFVENYEGIDIYENPYCIANGFYVNENITDWELSDYNPFISLNALSEDCLGGGEIFTHIPSDIMSMVSDDSLVSEFYINENTIFYTLVPEEPGDLYVNPSGIMHLGEYDADENINFNLRYTIRDEQNIYKNIVSYGFNSDALIDLYTSITSGNNMVSADTISEGALSGSISAPSDGYIFMNIPLEAGWTCTVNGTDTDMILISDTYAGIPVSAGSNSISLTYSPAYVIPGFIISILFVIAFVLLSVPVAQTGVSRVLIRIGKSRFATCITNHISNNRIYYLLFTIVTSLYVVMLMLKACTPFGDNFAVISDGLQLSYPQFYSIFENIRNGGFSLLNWSGGMAVDDYNLIGIFLLNPINYLYLLFPESASEFAFAMVYYVKFLLCGFAMIYYLTHRPKGKKLDKNSYELLGFGLAYGLSAFVISYYCFFGFMEVVALLPIIILGLERLLYEKKTLLYILSMLFLMVLGYYYAFLVCEFLLLYFFLSEFESIKDFFMKGVRFALSSILAVGMSGVLLIPYYMFTLTSPYRGEDSSIPAFNMENGFMSFFRSFMITSDVVVIDGDISRVNIYCGLIILLLLPLYMINKRIKFSVRIRKAVLVLVMIFSFGNELLNYVFHGFHFQSMVPNRYAVFLIFLLVTMAYDVYLLLSEYKPRTILISGGITAAVLLIFWLLNSDVTATPVKIVLSCIVLAVFIFCAIIYMIKKNEAVFKRSVCILLVVEVLFSATCQMPLTFGSTMSYTYLADIDKINSLSAEYDFTADLQTTEYSAAPFRDISYVSDFNSVTLFSNMLTGAHLDFATYWQDFASLNYMEYTPNPLIDMIFRVRYFITNINYDSSWCQYEEIDSQDNIILHENPYYVPLGILFGDNMNDFASKDMEDYDTIIDFYNEFSHSLGCGDIFVDVELEDDEDKLTEDSTYCMADATGLGEDGYGNVNLEMHIEPSVHGNLYIYDEYYMTYLGMAEEGINDTINITLEINEENEGLTVHLAAVDETVVHDIYEILSRTNMTNITYGSTGFSGDMNITEDGTVFLSIPHLEGYTAYIDGVEADIKDYMGGMGIDFTAGEHHIEFKYMTPGVIPGAILSGISIIIFIAYLFITLRGRKPREAAENA